MVRKELIFSFKGWLHYNEGTIIKRIRFGKKNLIIFYLVKNVWLLQDGPSKILTLNVKRFFK